VFFILVHSDFFGIPLPDHVSYANSKSEKFSIKDRLLQTFFFVKTEACDSKSENIK